MSANVWGWKTLGRTAVLTAAAAAVLWLAGRPDASGRAAPGDAPPRGEAGELGAVPADGVAVISFRFAEVWNNAALKPVREKLAKEAPDFIEHATQEMGVSPDDIERITGVMPSLNGPPAWATFITTIKPYDAKKVAAAIAPDGKEETVGGKKLQVGTNEQAVGFLSDRTYVRGMTGQVRDILRQAEAGKEGPLTPALREAAGKHVLVAGMNIETLAKVAPGNLPPDAAPFKPLLKAKNALLTVDLGDEVKADLRLTFPGEADAKEGEEAVNAGLDMARAALVMWTQHASEDKDFAAVVGMAKEAQAALRAAKAERNGSTVEVVGSMKLDAGKTGVAVLDGVQKVREAAARMQSANNLKQIALAMHAYNDANGHFPPQAVYDKDGKPLLSWRVLILPYVEQNELYKQFHLDEPWDSENNKKLMEQMPKVFAAPAQSEESLKNHETVYQGFAGKGAFFDGKKGLTFADVTDGLSNTIMAVEAAKPVPWSKPEDVPFDEGKLLPKVGGLYPHLFQVGMCDGSVRGISTSVKEETLRAAITRNGGEALGSDW